MSNEAPSPRYYTTEEYFGLPFNEQLTELEDGILTMSPSPVPSHARIQSNIIVQLGNYLRHKNCELFSELDVKLFDDEDIIYRPDIIVVCSPSKIGERCIEGAPDLVIEIGSPATLKHDLGKKRLNYERAGVREYWVIRNPYWVYTYILGADGTYTETVYKDQPTIKLSIFDLTIDFGYLQK
ncbi:MAG: Uma2 family endonuclease [Spirochaetaceae bacterium]|nr:Uma2 family endonuclease [Spirochaetaceae bacterium]